MIVFDIETGPLPDEQLADRVEAFVAPPHPGEFDPSAVKLGNLKDQAKIAEKIDAARAAHAAAVDRYAADTEAAKSAWWAEIKGRAALSPITGEVLAIGYLSTDTGKVLLDGQNGKYGERELIVRFWDRYMKCRQDKRHLVGHNIERFDVRFLMRRAWLLGLDVPASVLDRGKWLDGLVFVDTMVLWGEPVKLDVLARAFGVGSKLEGVDGSMFAELWKQDRAKAELYLRTDLEVSAAVAERMGIL